MAGKPKFLFAGDGGTYEDFEKKLLSEISRAGLTTEFKKKSFLYKHLTGTVLDTLTKLLFPIKISDKSFDELLVTLKTHYIPNKHLRERVILYARIQEEDEQTKDYFETLKDIASRCKYKDDELKLVLCDKVLTGIRCPRLREALYVAGISPSITSDKYMEYALLYEINVENEKLAKLKKANERNKKININKNIDRSPSPNNNKLLSDSPAAKFGVSLKKGNDNNNNSKNGNKGLVNWKPKVPLTPQSTFGVTLKSKSSIQVSPKSPTGPNADKPFSNGTHDNLNGMPSPKPMTIPEIMEIVKDPKKPVFTPDKNKTAINKSSISKSAQQRESSWSPSPSPEPRKPAEITPEAKRILDKYNQKKEPPNPPTRREPSREPSWSPSPSPEPRDSRCQESRGRSFAKDSATKMKRSNSTLNVRGKPAINDLSTKTSKTPAPKLKRSASSVSLSRNPLPEQQEAFDPMRSLRQGLAALKSVKHLKPEPDTTNKKEKFDISDKLPKLRSVGGCRYSPTEIYDAMIEIPEITDFEPRKPTITAEAKAILDKYLNKPPPPKKDPPKIQPRREQSYSPSPEPERKPELTRKPLVNKCAKPSTTLSNKSVSYSDLTKSDLFENFLQAKNTQTSVQKTQKPFKINKPAKKDEVPQLTDEVRRKLEEKYGIIKAKPKEPTIEESNEPTIEESKEPTIEESNESTIEESIEPEIEKSPNRNPQSRDMFKEKTNVSIFGAVKPSERVVQMYKESQQVKEALKEATFHEKSNIIPPNTPTEKPLSTVKASPKIAEMYKVQIMERDKNKCPSPPPEKVSSAVTRFADKKWVSTLDLSSSRKEYDIDTSKGPKSSRRREPSWSPSVSPEPHDEIPEIPEKIEPRKSVITDETKRIIDKYLNRKKEKEAAEASINKEPSISPKVSTEPQNNGEQLQKVSPKPSARRDPNWSPSVSPEPRDNRDQIKNESPKVPRRRDLNWSPSVSPEPHNDRSQLKEKSPKAYFRRDPNWSPSVSPEPHVNKDQLKNVSPKPFIKRDPYWSPSVSPEPKNNIDQVNKESQNPTVIRDPHWSPSVSSEPANNRDQLNNESPKPSIRRDPNWSPSVSPEPHDNKEQLKSESPKPSIRRDPNWSPSVSPEPHENKGPSGSPSHSPKSTKERDPYWSPSPSPEPKDTRCEDNRGRSSSKESPLQLKRSCSNVNARDKPTSNTTNTASALKRSSSSVSISRTPRILNEIPEITETIEPRKSSTTSESKSVVDRYYSKLRNKKNSEKYHSEREPSYSPSPEPEPGPDLTREQLFDKYAKPSKSSSYLDLTKSEAFDQFLQAKDSSTSKLKKQVTTNKKSKKEDVPQLTDEDRRKLEEKYGIIRGKPKDPNTEGEESPQPKRKKSPSRAQQNRLLFQEKEKALQTGLVKDTDKDKDEQNSNPLLSTPEKSNGITPKTSNEKPTIVIKPTTNIAEKYKAELEKQSQKSLERSLTEKAVSTIARSSEKRSSLDLTPLDLARMKKEYAAESLKKEALKYDIRECKYNAEADYGDSLLKVTEKDTFNVRTIKTEFFPQERADSPCASVKSVIPPKPGTAAAAKPQYDISSFFDGSAYGNYLNSAKSTKGGTK